MIKERKAYTVIIWGAGKCYHKYFNNIKYEEAKGNIKVVGVISKDTFISEFDGYRHLNKRAVLDVLYDYIIVMAEGKMYDEIIQEAVALNIPRECLIKGEVLSVPGFDFRSYIGIKKSRVSIIADCCWGGMVSHRMCLPFLSPFINTYVKKNDYIKLLENLEYYLKQPVECDTYQTLTNTFPVLRLDDICVYASHDLAYEEVIHNWRKRTERINFDNLLVEMRIDSDYEMAERFQRLPYKNKIGFSSVKMNYDSVVWMPEYEYEKNKQSRPVDYERMENLEFWEYITTPYNRALDNIDYFKLLNGEIQEIRRRKVLGE